MDINKKNIHIWQVDIKALSVDIDFFLYFLNKNEKIKANTYRFFKDYEVYVITRAILRILLGRYLNDDAKELKFKFNDFGKPFLSCNNSLKFNVSHSGNRAIIGFVRDYGIGIDIEYIKKDFDVLNVAENFFSKDEISKLKAKSIHELHPSFYRCWTRKESFIKAQGSGLSYPLDSFSVSIDSDDEARLENIAILSEEKNKWTMFSFVPHENYISAVTVNGHVPSYQLFDWKSTQTMCISEKNAPKILKYASV